MATDELGIPDFLDRRPKGEAKAKPTSWRDALPVHPAADLFPLMTRDELKALGEDIKKNGLQSPIMYWQENSRETPLQLLDGRNRLDAMEAVGILHIEKWGELRVTDPDGRKRNWGLLSDVVLSTAEEPVDPYAYVISANIHRRHLTTAQRIELVEKIIKANPEMSSRRAAKLAGVAPTTATKSRQKLEQSGDVSTVDTSIDTKGRKQPTKKKRRTPDDFAAEMKARKTAKADPATALVDAVDAAWPQQIDLEELTQPTDQAEIERPAEALNVVEVIALLIKKSKCYASGGSIFNDRSCDPSFRPKEVTDLIHWLDGFAKIHRKVLRARR